MDELSQEEVFRDEKDPLDAIREIREAEGNSEAVEAIDEETPEEIVPVEEKPTEEPDEIFDEEGSADDEQENANEEEGNEETKEEVTAAFKKFKANGQEFEFTQDEVNEQFESVFGKAMDYTKKTQQLAPYRKMISAMEEEGITQEQFNTAIDAIKGDKDALRSIIKDKEIDTFDLDTEEDFEYSPTDYGKNDQQLALEETVARISNDAEYSITTNVVDEQWDSSSRDVLANNPQMIEGLHNDIKTGVYDKVSPLAMKMKVLDGNTKSDLDYYMLAGEQLAKATESQGQVATANNAIQEANTKFEQASSQASTKRAATSTKSRPSGKGVIDYLDDNDEAFDSWYKKLESSY